MSDGDVRDRYANRLAQALDAERERRGWSIRKMARHMRLNHVTVGSLIDGLSIRPEWPTIESVAELLEIPPVRAQQWLSSPPTDRDDLEAMVDAPRRSGPVDQNVTPINWDAMSPEEAKLLQRLLRGALDVYEARERGEG